jgi:hypothetical protein
MLSYYREKVEVFEFGVIFTVRDDTSERNY